MRIASSCETKRSCLPNSRGTAHLKTMSSSRSSVWMNRSSFLELFYCCAYNVCFALPFILLYNCLKYRWPQLMLICCLFSRLLSDPAPTEVRTPLCFSCRSWMSVHTLQYRRWLSPSAHKQLYTNSFQSSPPLKTRGFLMLKSSPNWRMSSHSQLFSTKALWTVSSHVYTFKKKKPGHFYLKFSQLFFSSGGRKFLF